MKQINTDVKKQVRRNVKPIILSEIQQTNAELKRYETQNSNTSKLFAAYYTGRRNGLFKILNLIEALAY